jgi:hypothetical protein
MRAPWVVTMLALAVLTSACRGIVKPKYEYEEELYLNLNGSATVYVNASVPALVALRGVELDVSRRARFDRERVRAIFRGPNVDVASVSSSRRNGRRFVHVRLDARRLADLSKLAPLSWSTYRLARREEILEFQQVVGPAADRSVGDVRWTGQELVAFRMHLPSKIPWHNSKDSVQRGNILAWEQPLAERLKSVPVDIQAHMEAQSILYQTLLLFGLTIVAAAMAFVLVLWWVARKGRDTAIAESRP